MFVSCPAFLTLFLHVCVSPLLSHKTKCCIIVWRAAFVNGFCHYFLTCAVNPLLSHHANCCVNVTSRFCGILFSWGTHFEKHGPLGVKWRVMEWKGGSFSDKLSLIMTVRSKGVVWWHMVRHNRILNAPWILFLWWQGKVVLISLQMSECILLPIASFNPLLLPKMCVLSLSFCYRYCPHSVHSNFISGARI